MIMPIGPPSTGMAKTLSPRYVPPGALPEIALHLVRTVWGQVDQRVLDREAAQLVGLQHDHIGKTLPCRDPRLHLGVLVPTFTDVIPVDLARPCGFR